MKTIEKIWNVLKEDFGPQKAASLIGKIQLILSDSESLEDQVKTKPLSEPDSDATSAKPIKKTSRPGMGFIPDK